MKKDTRWLSDKEKAEQEKKREKRLDVWLNTSAVLLGIAIMLLAGYLREHGYNESHTQPIGIAGMIILFPILIPYFIYRLIKEIKKRRRKNDDDEEERQ